MINEYVLVTVFVTQINTIVLLETFIIRRSITDICDLLSKNLPLTHFQEIAILNIPLR